MCGVETKARVECAGGYTYDEQKRVATAFEESFSPGYHFLFQLIAPMIRLAPRGLPSLCREFDFLAKSEVVSKHNVSKPSFTRRKSLACHKNRGCRPK